jgi:redox-sensitive bicupin YhaK (pirin superfamily)
METATKAIIHLSDQRGHLENEWMRSLMSFNFGNYQAESRQPFGSLQVFNEDTLAPGKSIKMVVEENTEVIIIPLVGTLTFKNTTGNEVTIDPGQLQLFSAATQMNYEITNPFEKDELVNFLQIWLYKNEGVFTAHTHQFDFDLSLTNHLHKVLYPANLHQKAYCYIGKYEGRKKDDYVLKNKNNGVFAFVIEGVFEVQDRLLHAKDGLAIWDADEIDFEALSNGAILLLLEVPNV